MPHAGKSPSFSSYLASLDSIEREVRGSQPESIHHLRKAAMASFISSGFPDTHQEEWRFTNLAPITGTQFKSPAARGRLLRKGSLEPFFLGLENRATLWRGKFNRELSLFPSIPEGVIVGGLRDVLQETPATVESHLGHYAHYDQDPFVALNTALAPDGIFIHVPRGLVVEVPLHALMVMEAEELPVMTAPRILVIVGEGSQLSFVEHYAGLNGGNYLTNAVTEIIAGEGAVVEHIRLQEESNEAYHVSTLQIQQERSSSVSSYSVVFGGALTRNNVNVRLGGSGSDCRLNGLFVTGGRQHVDNQTRIDHEAPECSSRELYKGILDGRSHGVFNGRIVVHKDAVKTNAKQTNRNLLLSDTALMNTNPQLEIYTDDVKCAHGSTVGHLDDEILFYFRTRGIGTEEALHLMITAFAGEVITSVRAEALREALSGRLAERLSPGKQPIVAPTEPES